MTLEARVHRPCPGRDHYGQLIHLPMTGDAANALMNMDAVIEINVVRKIVDACPFNRSPFLEALANRFQPRVIDTDLGMTVHAGFGRRQARKRAVLHGGMAVTAIQP